MAIGITGDLAGSGFGFFMEVLAVNQCGEAVAGVLFNSFPNVENGTASGVDQDATDVVKGRHVFDGDAEGGNDYDVVFCNAGKIKSTFLVGQ